MMKYVGLVGLFILFCLAGLVFVVPSLIPSETYQSRIEQQLSAELGRDVAIEGDVTLSTFPALKARAANVSIANPPGFSQTDFATLDGLDARVKLLPLLSKRVEISRFTLRQPEIYLERLEDGSVNWLLTDESPPEEEPSSEGPFKRDGRYTDLDPSIRAFNIENGSLIYVDRQSGQDVRLSAMNLFLSAPALNETFLLDGSLTFNSQPVEADISLSSPEAFLNGESAEFIADIAFSGNTFSFEGRIPAGEDLAASGDINANLTNVAPIVDLVPALKLPDGFTALTMDGVLNYGPGAYSLTSSRVDVEGIGYAANYNGDIGFDGKPSATGSLSASIDKPEVLTPYFQEEPNGFELLRTLEVDTKLETESDGSIRFREMNAEVTGDGFDAAYRGSGTFDDILTLEGVMTASTPDAGKLADYFAPGTTGTGLLEAVQVEGAFTMANETITIDPLVATLDGEALNGQLTGSISGTLEQPQFDGSFHLSGERVRPRLAAEGIELPAALQSLESYDLEASLSYEPENLTLTELVAKLESPQFTAAYAGEVAIRDAATFDGSLSLEGPSLRKLLETEDQPLPPSIDDSPVFENFRLAGDMTGTDNTIKVENATIALDDLEAEGDVSIKFDQARPYADFRIRTPHLDLRPYMKAYSAQFPEGEIRPWSKEPLPVSGMRSFDSDFVIDAGKISLTRLSFGETTAKGSLKSGLLSVEMDGLSLYEGAGDVSVSFDAGREVPTFRLDAALDDVRSERFLSDLAGFNNASGSGSTSVSLSGSGRTQAEIMSSLRGEGLMTLVEGVLEGIDATKFLGGIDEALTSRSLPGGIGADYATRFNDLLGSFEINDGVASIGTIKLEGAGFSAETTGSVDLGRQSIDLRFRPRAVGDQANGLAGFGIPLRYSGPFGNAKPSLDTEFLGRIVAARAEQEARDLISDRIGEQGAGVLGTIIGGSRNSETENGREQQPGQDRSLEDVIGSVIGSGRETTGAENAEADPTAEEPTDPQTTEQAQPEDQIENVLKGLFGRKSESED